MTSSNGDGRTVSIEDFSRARQAAWLRRAYGVDVRGSAEAEAVVAAHHYTNLWRELDRTTLFLFNGVQRPLTGSPVDLVAETVAFRAFNRMETYETYHPVFPRVLDLTDGGQLHGLLAGRRNFTGAYVRCPDLRGVCDVVADLRGPATEIAAALAAGDPRAAWRTVRGLYSFGPFLADQLVMDLDWPRGPLADTGFAPAWGPGATRGLEFVQRTAGGSPEDVRARIDAAVPVEWRPTIDGQPAAFTLATLEHTLCEFYKHVKHAEADGRRVKMRANSPSGRTGSPVPWSWGAPFAATRAV
jgi:hypothetical protein